MLLAKPAVFYFSKYLKDGKKMFKIPSTLTKCYGSTKN